MLNIENVHSLAYTIASNILSTCSNDGILKIHINVLINSNSATCTPGCMLDSINLLAHNILTRYSTILVESQQISFLFNFPFHEIVYKVFNSPSPHFSPHHFNFPIQTGIR